MRRAAGHDEAVAGADRQFVQHPLPRGERSSQCFATETLPIQPLVESEEQVGSFPLDLAGRNHIPRLGLAKLRMKVPPGVRHARVNLNRQPFGGVENLHQQRGICAILRRMFPPQRLLRIGSEPVAEQHLPARRRHPAQPLLHRRILRVVRRGSRSDPVLGEMAVLHSLRPPEQIDAAPSAIDPPHPVRQKFHSSGHLPFPLFFQNPG